MAWTDLESKFWQMMRKNHHHFHSVLEKLDLYPGQPHLLTALSWEEGIPQKVLAQKIFVTPSTLATMLNRMEKKGLILRRADGEDGRIKNVYLTKEGRKKLREFQALMDKTNELVFAGIEGEDRKMLIHLLDKINTNLDGMKRIQKEKTCSNC